MGKKNKRKKIRVMGHTVTIITSSSSRAKKDKAWTTFNEKNKWTKQITLYSGLSKDKRQRLLSHELAEGISGIGSKMPSKKRHRKIAHITGKVRKILKKRKRRV